MALGNPIHLAQKLDWDTVPGKPSYMPKLQSLRVSHNGQYIALGNENTIYTFDLHQPGLGWQQGVEIKDAIIVTPTDSGGYWALCFGGKILLVNSKGKINFESSTNGKDSIWGNDDWILTHDREYFEFSFLTDLRIHKVRHKHVILHAWMQDSQLRLLSISSNNKKLYLHEWNCDQHTPVLKSSINYPHIFGVEGIDALYILCRHVHAWPGRDKSVTVKLKPWAVTISSDGAIQISEDHVSWLPIIRGDVPLSREVLARVSACALDRGLDASYLEFSKTPYLITTLQDADTIYIISTLWCKRLPVKHIDMLTEDHLDACLDDKDVATLFLANCEGYLPTTEKTALAILRMLDSRDYSEKYMRILGHLGSRAISDLLRVMFPKKIQKSFRSKWISHVAFSEMYKLLNTLTKKHDIACAFFDSFDDPCLKNEDQDRLVATIKSLIPLLPARTRALVPASLRVNVPTLHDSIAAADRETAKFLLEMAPGRWFVVNNVILLLERFRNDAEILAVIIQRFAKQQGKLAAQACDKQEQLHQCIAQLIDAVPHVRYQVLASMLDYDIPFPESIDDPCVDFIRVLNMPEIQIQAAANFLADQSNNDNRQIHTLILAILKKASKTRLIPSFIHTMAGLNCTDNKASLVEIDAIDSDILASSEYVIIDTLWRPSDGLDDPCRKAYATVLLAAIRRFMGKDAMSAHALDKHCSSKASCITREAMLLQKSLVQRPLPIQEILDFIGSVPE